MKITTISDHVFRLEFDDEELLHFMIILASSPHHSCHSIESLLHYLLTWIEQKWYETAKEPLTNGNPGAG